MLHVPSSHLGLWSTAPEQINPPRTRNGTARIVVEHKTRGRPPGRNLALRIQHWLLYLDERQSAWREEALGRGYGTARHKEQAQIAQGPPGNRLKEDVARITVQHARRL